VLLFNMLTIHHCLHWSCFYVSFQLKCVTHEGMICLLL